MDVDEGQEARGKEADRGVFIRFRTMRATMQLLTTSISLAICIRRPHGLVVVMALNWECEADYVSGLIHECASSRLSPPENLVTNRLSLRKRWSDLE